MRVNGETAGPATGTASGVRSAGVRATGRPAPQRLASGRLLVIIPGGLALLLGLDAGLLLLGLPAPLTFDRLATLHAPLLVFGFIGTLVTMERAVALRQWWGFLTPILLGFGMLATLTPLPLLVGQLMLTAGLIGQLGLYTGIWRRQVAVATAIQALGALAALAAALLWLGHVPISHLAPLLAVFLILTIAGERVELSRVAFSSGPSEQLGLAASIALTVTAAAALIWPDWGYPLLGLSLLALVAWLLRYDVAIKTVRAAGLTRFVAACLLAGYFWLGVAGAIWVLRGPVWEGPGYDAVLHSIFLGFVMSMILAHAPLIMPAVLRTPLPYTPLMYVPAVLLHASLALRVLVGDLREWPLAVQIGGVGNIVALLVFVLVAVGSAVWARPRRTTAPLGRAPVGTTQQGLAHPAPTAAKKGESL